MTKLEINSEIVTKATLAVLPSAQKNQEDIEGQQEQCSIFWAMCTGPTNCNRSG